MQHEMQYFYDPCDSQDCDCSGALCPPQVIISRIVLSLCSQPSTLLFPTSKNWSQLAQNRYDIKKHIDNKQANLIKQARIRPNINVLIGKIPSQTFVEHRPKF